MSGKHPVEWFRKRVNDNDEFGDLAREMQHDELLQTFPALSWQEFELHLKQLRHAPPIVSRTARRSSQLCEPGIERANGLEKHQDAFRPRLQTMVKRTTHREHRREHYFICDPCLQDDSL